MLSLNHAKYVEFIVDELVKGTKHSKTTLEGIAKKQFQITDQNQVKELTELAIVMRARFLANQPGKSTEQRYYDIVDLYKSQVNLSHRTSQSMLLQQYSTPAPISYLAGVFCGIPAFGTENKFLFEPSAGNGLLTIAIDNLKHCIVNEIDDFRYNNLKSQDFRQVTKFDATQDLKNLIAWSGGFDAIITNPPFGKTPFTININGYKFDTLEQVMAIRALDLMKDSGKAAIIIGGHTTWDKEGRIQAGKNRIFLSYLYKHYNVADIILIDGHKLYSRQGTAFNTRMILIDGRKRVPEGYAPLFNKKIDFVVDSFDGFYYRVWNAMGTNTIVNHEIEAEALVLELELLNLSGLNGLTDDKFNKAIIKFKKDRIKHSPLLVGYPSSILQKHGIKNLPIYIDYNIINKATKVKHWLRIEDFISLGRKLENPTAIFRSKSHPLTSKVILIDLVDSLGRKVIAIFRMDGKNNIDISSIYGKDSKQSLLRWEQEGLLEFKDKKKWDNL